MESKDEICADQPTTTSSGESEALELLKIKTAVPLSTHAERKRFLLDCHGDRIKATDRLNKYIEWRREYCDDASSEEDPWMYANHMLQKHCERNSSNKHDDSMDTTTNNLPRIVYTHKTTQSSTRYVQHLPARIDTSLATPSMYALVLAIYLEHLFDRNSFEKITLVVDVRAGRGWANIPALHLIPFMQACCKLLCDLHPERLQSCILFPLPKVATVIWRAVKPVFGSL